MRPADKPTLKQIEFAKDIAYTLHIQLPEKQTKFEYSKFISENMKDFKKKTELENFDWDSHGDNYGDRI